MALEKAIILNTVTGERTPVLFNPEEYTVDRDVNYAQINVPGLSSPIVQFVSGGARTLQMELLVDTYEAHVEGGRALNRAGEDVRNLTRRITGLMEIDPTTHTPPVLLFQWASLAFTCVLSRVSQRFVLFRPDGTPVRAYVNVTFSEFRNVDLEPKEVKRETADYTKARSLGQADSLQTLSTQEYGTPTAWRAIARANGIDDPRALDVGQVLIVPKLPYTDPQTGDRGDA